MKLVKIKLINWHIFSNHTIEFNGNTLITGENACGKSTLMDAIYFVLSGGDSNHFNKAANDGGKRTLESYIRGKIGSERNPYLRNESEIVSYVILEFFDEKMKESLTLGSEIETYSLNSDLKLHFFVINKYSINDNDFIKDNKPLDFRSLKSNFKVSSYSLEELPSTFRDRKKVIGRDIFKLTDYKRFFELLQRAISFRPISEVSTFVNEFLLEEDNINLDSLKEEIRSYQEIRNSLEKEEAKINFLDNFVGKAEKYKDNEINMTYLNALKIDSKVEQLEAELKRKKLDLSRIESDYKELENEENDLKTREFNLNRELYQLENNEEYKALKQKEENLSKYESELKEKNLKLEEFSKSISSEQKIIRSLGLSYRLDSDYLNKDYALLNEHLRRYEVQINELKDKFDDERAKINFEIKNDNYEKTSKENELLKLKQGINNYQDDVKNLINIAKNAIIEFNPKETEPNVKPFCEYIEILNKEWTNALEGYLNTQRFNIIVEPKYYDVVTKAFNNFKNKTKVYIAGIVNVNKIPEVEVIENSMMNNINVSNEYALKYAKYLLGNLACVDDVLELKNYKSSITKEVMIYKNYVLKACNPEIYLKPYIGSDSLKRRIELLENEINTLSIKINKETEDLNEISSKLSLVKSNKVDKILETPNLWNEIEILTNNINSLKGEIEKDQKASGLFGISERINNCKNNLNNIRVLGSINSDKKNKNRVRLGEVNNSVDSINNILELSKKELNDFIRGLNEDIFNEKHENYSSNNKLDIERINKDYDICKGYNNVVKEFLENVMREYSYKFKASLTPLIENLSDYINEYYYVKNRDVVKYKEEAHEAYIKAERSFKEDFISKLKEKIEKSQKTLDKINKNLVLHPFGNDEEIYKFSYGASKDSEFGNYYRIITSGKLMESRDLFTEVLDEKDNSYMNDLFNKISLEANSSEQEKELNLYLDYRNYMNYDIKITNKSGDESYFSKINKEKSGGETQTPFYIVIASCFDELMNKDNKNPSTSIVVFDEAFNNMDEGRIKSLMEFYKDLNIQLMIIVPSNRIGSIAPYMDTIVGIVKKENYPITRSINKEVKDE